MATTLKRPDEPGGRERGSARFSSFIRTHKPLVAAMAVVGVGLAIFAFLWLRPDKLFVDTRVNDALPTVRAPGASGSPAGSTGAPAAQAVVLSSGQFRNLEHETTGTAKIVRLADGSRIVRLEDFETSSGPDVVVILSATRATEDSWGAYDDDGFVILGSLRGNIGNQNYKIPANVDLSKYRSVVIWCRRFNVAFGASPISTAA